MKTRLLAATTILALSLATEVASAADVTASTYDWTGFYLGAAAGYSWSNDGGVRFDGRSGGSRQQVIDVGILKSVLGSNPDGFVGGLEGGYNWQVNDLVVGVETDFSYSDINGSGFHYFDGGEIYFPTTSKASQSLDWFGSARLRLGYALDNILIYGTGGLAYGDTSVDYKVDSFGTFKDSSSEWRVGWTIGGGAEYAIDRNWTAKVEYLYYDLGKNSAKGYFDAPFEEDTLSYSAEFKGNIVRAGVNYRF